MGSNLSGSLSRAGSAATSGSIVVGTGVGTFAAAAALLLSGCPDRPISRLDVEPNRVERVEIPAVVKDKLDLLFVMDNSHSMSEEQESLKTNFRRFTRVLETIEGGLPNLHIGVVTSDMGTMGGLSFAGCSGFGDNGNLRSDAAVTSARYLETYRDPTTGERVTNFQGSLEDAFGKLAVVGVGGCNFEAHLMSMKRALVGTAGNSGFLRDDAYLAVVLIADEDDCSIREDRASFFSQPDVGAGADKVTTTLACFRSSTLCDGPRDSSAPGPRTNCRSNDADSAPFNVRVSEMVKFLKDLKGERNVLVAGIVGPGRDVALNRDDLGNLGVTPSCSYGTMPVQTARPAIRLEAFIRSFSRHTIASICKEDLSGALDQVGKLVVQVFPRCFDAQVVEPHECSVLDILDPDGPDRDASPLPECDAAHSATPCWHLEEDLVACAGSQTKLTLRVDRGGALPPPNSVVTAECVTR